MRWFRVDADDVEAADADVVINGHDHDYERFAPQDPKGREDRVKGIREFVEAARSLGANRRRIYVKELLPHLWAPLLVYVTLVMPANISARARAMLA